MSEYEVGGLLYEATQARENLRVWPVIREWRIISVVIDDDWRTEDDRPIRIVTMRAWEARRDGTLTRAIYLVLQDWEIDIKIKFKLFAHSPGELDNPLCPKSAS